MKKKTKGMDVCDTCKKGMKLPKKFGRNNISSKKQGLNRKPNK